MKRPPGTVLVTDRPTFAWQPVEGAGSYLVEVYDADFNPVLTSGPILGLTWTAPGGLSRGAVYSWQVTATAGGRVVTIPAPPAPEARFEVASPDVAAAVMQSVAAHPDSRPLRAVVYARAGAVEEARGAGGARRCQSGRPGPPDTPGRPARQPHPCAVIRRGRHRTQSPARGAGVLP